MNEQQKIAAPNYPIYFSAEAEAPKGLVGAWQARSESFSLDCSIPQVFGGSGQGLSPEDLFAQALANCFLASLKVFALASRIEFSKASVKAKLTLDKSESNSPLVTHCNFDIEILGVERPERVESLVRKVFLTGFILNSVKAKIDYSLSIDGVAR